MSARTANSDMTSPWPLLTITCTARPSSEGNICTSRTRQSLGNLGTLICVAHPRRRHPAGESYLSDTGANASWRSGETPAPHAPDGYERGHGHPPAYPMYRWPPSRAPTPALPPPRGADAVRRSAPNLPAFSCVVHRTERQRARPLRSEEHTSEL